MKSIILAISGGVDSVAMLHSLVFADGFAKVKFSRVQYTVAYFDHGIRDDSSADARFVQKLAESYGLQYESENANLGRVASEASARKARWDFLQKAKIKLSADLIATAHHVDDVFETQLINVIRGTGRRGIRILGDSDRVIRPLISRNKSEVYDYVLKHNLEFVEDSTNIDTDYLRNRLRLVEIPKLKNKDEIKQLFARINEINPQIDELLAQIYEDISIENEQKIELDRTKFRQLPKQIQCELIYLAINKIGHIHAKQKLSTKTIESIAGLAMRSDSNKYLHVSKLLQTYISREKLVIESRKIGL